MKNQLERNEESIPKASTLVQTYHGKQILLSTRFITLYHKLGLVISNITSFYQYKPARALAPFTEAVTVGRKRATIEGNETLALANKLIGNSGNLNILYKFNYELCQMKEIITI